MKRLPCLPLLKVQTVRGPQEDSFVPAAAQSGSTKESDVDSAERQTATSLITFTQDEDPAHRLHVCSECHGALPTVFQEALGGTMDFDVEQTASSIIQSLYAEKVSKEE